MNDSCINRVSGGFETADMVMVEVGEVMAYTGGWSGPLLENNNDCIRT